MLVDKNYTDAHPEHRILDRHRMQGTPKFVGEAPVVKSIATGLAPGLNLETTIPANPKIVAAITRLHEIKELHANWDSYGSQAVSATSFRPALELIIEAVHRCKEPSIVPLAEGGIGLRWEEAGKALELDVQVDEAVEAYAEGVEIDEPVNPMSIKEAMELLVRYCRT
ncbi:hypothetical protein [Sphingopyxis fribergensis]|nr:hypothetical protein [Sphingopyxis fribergensis]